MLLSFAYGSNMDVAAMRARCPGSRPLGPARLARHRLVIMREGYLSVSPDPRRSVEGLLWDVALADMAALDRYEEVAGGLYAKRTLPVLTGPGARRALVYVGTNAGPGAPRPGYLDAILAAAEAAGLSPRCLAEIASLGRTRVERHSALPSPVRTAVRVIRRPIPSGGRARPIVQDPLRSPSGWRWSP